MRQYQILCWGDSPTYPIFAEDWENGSIKQDVRVIEKMESGKFNGKNHEQLECKSIKGYRLRSAHLSQGGRLIYIVEGKICVILFYLPTHGYERVARYLKNTHAKIFNDLRYLDELLKTRNFTLSHLAYASSSNTEAKTEEKAGVNCRPVYYIGNKLVLLNEEQVKAQSSLTDTEKSFFKETKKQQVHFLSGSPGAGKTTVVLSYLLRLLGTVKETSSEVIDQDSKQHPCLCVVPSSSLRAFLNQSYRQVIQLRKELNPSLNQDNKEEEDNPILFHTYCGLLKKEPNYSLINEDTAVEIIQDILKQPSNKAMTLSLPPNFSAENVYREFKKIPFREDKENKDNETLGLVVDSEKYFNLYGEKTTILQEKSQKETILHLLSTYRKKLCTQEQMDPYFSCRI